MLRLLLVEDEYIEREAMKHIISQRFQGKFEIKEASNGLEATELAKVFKPQIVFLDIKMPGCSGIEVARRLREFLPDANMIFITAYDYFDYAKEAISLRVDEFLLKPVDVDEVCKYIEKVMHKLEEEKLPAAYTEKMEQEFSVIKRKFQMELKELLLDNNAKEERITQYLHLMDIKMACAVIGLIDFTTIAQYEEIGSIQKEFIKERLKCKLERKCEQNEIIALTGELKDLMTVIFIVEQEERAQIDYASRVANIEKKLKEDLDECIRLIGMSISYQLSKPVMQAGDIPAVLEQEKERLFELTYKEKKSYPYEIEDDVIEYIRKKEFEAAREAIIRLIADLKSECEFIEFRNEIQGLYTMIERAMRRNASQCLMPHAERIASDISSYIEMENFYNRLMTYAKNMMGQMPDRNQMLIEKICRYLEVHYNEDISLEEAASMIGFSSFYFTKLMKEYMNMSYVDYITSLRVDKAKQLLEKTKMSVKDVGIAVGYENANYFTRVFKRIEGVAPSQYKNRFS
nr:response regulator [uncultured Cellulosilyticum sp.]